MNSPSVPTRDTHAVVGSQTPPPSSEAGFAADVAILYGGSVKPDNTAELLAVTNVDGVLVGGASLDPGSFASIAEAG